MNALDKSETADGIDILINLRPPGQAFTDVVAVMAGSVARTRFHGMHDRRSKSVGKIINNQLRGPRPCYWV
jgi:hypothetical protein